MQLRFGTSAALSLFAMLLAACAWAIPQEQENAKQSSSPEQNQLRQPANQAAPLTTQQDDLVKPKKPEKFTDETQLYMRAKLVNSQKVLEGLVTENFALIDKGAKQMKMISKAAHWPDTVDEVYQHYSVSFRKQCDKLAEQAERRDLQAAHYTYLHMSTTCIDCHNYVRGRFRVERKKKGGPVRLIPTYWDGKEPPQPDDDQDKNG